MLGIRQNPRACSSCRNYLLTLFESGFTVKYERPLRRTLQPFALRSAKVRQRHLVARSFTSTTKVRDNGNVGDEIAQSQESQLRVDREAVVRQAKETFGNTLPADFLNHEEYRLYERLYGPPLRETRPEDLEFFVNKAEDDVPKHRASSVLQETVDGNFEEIDADPASFHYQDGDGELPVQSSTTSDLESQSDGYEGDVHIDGHNQREIDAIMQLRRDVEMAEVSDLVEEEDVDEEFDELEQEEEEDDDITDELDLGDPESSDSVRSHPNTIAGRFGTHPSTLELPKETFVHPITELLDRVNAKHLKEAAEKAFGGPGLPYSASTPASKNLLPQKHIGLEAGQGKMSEIEADSYLAAVMPGVYASIMSALVETRKRLGASWLRDLVFREGGNGPRVLDAGAGGAGIAAWRAVLGAEWDVLKSEGIVEGSEIPYGQSTVLTGSSTLRHRISRFLDNTTFLPRLPDHVHSSNSQKLLYGAPLQGRKFYDIIIAPHTLLPLHEDYKRKAHVQNLWSLLDPKGGVLILIEKGLPRGFEAIAGARAMLLSNHISSPGEALQERELQDPTNDGKRYSAKGKGMIVAPCTNHGTCPMYKVPGTSQNRKDFCHFEQRFFRPSYLQRILGAKNKNHEDVKYSYVVVRRGIDLREQEREGHSPKQNEEATVAAFQGYEHDVDDLSADPGSECASSHLLHLPRAIMPPLKRRGHVTLDLCTPSATIERWTVPRSFSKQAYRDARKSKWGDLWALGAKTRVVRSARIGRSEEKGGKKSVFGGKMGGLKRQGEGSVKRKNKKKDVFEIEMGEQGMENIRYVGGGKVDRNERRTKGGRRAGRGSEIREEELL